MRVYCLIAVGAVGFGACFDFVLRIVLMYCLLVCVLCYWFVCYFTFGLVAALFCGCVVVRFYLDFWVLGCGCSFGWF